MANLKSTFRYRGEFISRETSESSREGKWLGAIFRGVDVSIALKERGESRMIEENIDFVNVPLLDR